jgi:hypothetical protein
VLAFLRQLQPTGVAPAPERKARRAAAVEPVSAQELATPVIPAESVLAPQPDEDRSVRFTMLGMPCHSATAAQALVEILGKFAISEPGKVPELAEGVRCRSRSMIARAVTEINPARPDHAQGAEFASGWFVGLNLSNRNGMAIIRSACAVFGIRMPEDLHVALFNAT